MRLLIMGTVLGLAFSIAWGEAAPQSPKGRQRDILESLSDRNIQRSLGSGVVVCGNLIKGGQWYVLNVSEIRAVCKVLEQERRSVEGGGSIPQFPVPIYTIVLWGTTRDGLAPLKVLSVDRSVRVLQSIDEPGWYVPSGDERECIHGLARRIEEGKERAIVQNPGANAEASSDKVSPQ